MIRSYKLTSIKESNSEWHYISKNDYPEHGEYIYCFFKTKEIINGCLHITQHTAKAFYRHDCKQWFLVDENDNSKDFDINAEVIAWADLPSLDKLEEN